MNVPYIISKNLNVLAKYNHFISTFSGVPKIFASLYLDKDSNEIFINYQPDSNSFLRRSGLVRIKNMEFRCYKPHYSSFFKFLYEIEGHLNEIAFIENHFSQNNY